MALNESSRWSSVLSALAVLKEDLPNSQIEKHLIFLLSTVMLVIAMQEYSARVDSSAAVKQNPSDGVPLGAVNREQLPLYSEKAGEHPLSQHVGDFAVVIQQAAESSPGILSPDKSQPTGTILVQIKSLGSAMWNGQVIYYFTGSEATCAAVDCVVSSEEDSYSVEDVIRIIPASSPR